MAQHSGPKLLCFWDSTFH